MTFYNTFKQNMLILNCNNISNITVFIYFFIFFIDQINAVEHKQCPSV